MKIVSLPDAELEVMQVIWRNTTPISTSKVLNDLNERRPWSVSALQTILNRLIAKEFLTSEKYGKNRFYNTVVTEEAYLSFENHRYLKQTNSGSVTKFVASLFTDKNISKSDLDELYSFIEEKRKK